MSARADRFTIHTDPELRRALQRWLDVEREPQTRLDALQAAAEVARLAGEVLEQRVVEARSFRHSWAEIAAVLGITRQSAHRRWRHLDDAAEVLAAERQRRFRSARPSNPPPPGPREERDDWDAWRPGPAAADDACR